MSAVRWLIAIAVLGGACWLFPIFHVVPLKKNAKEKAAAVFNPTQFAETFWESQLLPSISKAVKAEMLLSAIQSNPADSKKKFSRSVGVADNYFYFVSGSGIMMAISDDEIVLNLNCGTNAEVSLQTGLIFGNALRDGTGLLDANSYPNSQDFNAISEALNHLVETRVVSKWKGHVRIGEKISFAGCAEVDDESTDLKPLKVIPIELKSE
jgi:predicted lipoprotein